MACRAIPIIAFRVVEFIYYIYIYTCMLVSLTRVCIVYVVKEVVSFQGAQALGQLMGMAHKRMHHTQATD